MKFFVPHRQCTLVARNYFRFLCSHQSEQFKPIIKKCLQFSENIAVVDNKGVYKYKDLIYMSSVFAKRIKESINKPESSQRISFACSNSATYISILLGCWLSGKIAVPLSINHPSSVLEYYIKDSESSLVIADDAKSSELQTLAKQLNIPFLAVEHPSKVKENVVDALDVKGILETYPSAQDENTKNNGAMIIYTSGTTGQPKGVLLTHGNFNAQVTALIEAWGWSSKDVILHTLPLYHMHGIMNAMLCPLSIGATIVLRPKFEAHEVWEYMLNLHNKIPKVNLFFGVPTMYIKLIKELEKWPEENKNKIKDTCLGNIRLMTSGSAPLPTSVFEQWENITGHQILERYGMSEIGMALSNTLVGPRMPGFVGIPLPGVEVRITDIDGSKAVSNCLVDGKHGEVTITPGCEQKSGELLVKGANVFKKYWNKTEQTKSAFTSDGWFKTGDTAVYENGAFKLLGRTSMDIIKSSGYKISALFIESHLLSHPDILDCAVIGVPDEERGEKVALVFACKGISNSPPMELQTWCSKYMPPYMIPSLFVHVGYIPRNAMGKVNKKELGKFLFPTKYREN